MGKANELGQYFLNEKAIFDSDIVALEWCLTKRTHDVSIDEFIRLHHSLTMNIRKTKIRLLEFVNSERIICIIKGWIKLYLRYYDYLLGKFPYNSVELKPFDDLCKRLSLSKQGLRLLSMASRYAECWAEESVRSDIYLDQLGDRLKFIGQAEFEKINQLRYTMDLLAYDCRGLALTSFDIAILARSASEGTFLWRSFAQQDYFLCIFSALANSVMGSLAGVRYLHFGVISWSIHLSAKVNSISGESASKMYSIKYGAVRGAGNISMGYLLILENDYESIAFTWPTSKDAAFHIFLHLRTMQEYCKIIVSSQYRDALHCVFPNQPIKLVQGNSSPTYSRRFLEIISSSELCILPKITDDLCALDDWWFDGEDYSFRNARAHAME